MFPSVLTKVGLSAARFIVTHSPEILMGVGTVASVGAVAFGLKDSPKAMEQLKADIAEIKEIKYRFTAEEYAKSREEVGYDKKAYAIDICRSTFKLAKNFCRNYWRTLALEALALISFGGAYHIISERFAQAVAFGASIKKAFDAYRDRVREKYGDEVERDLYLGNKDKLKKGTKDAEGNDIAGSKESGDEVTSDVTHLRIDRKCKTYTSNIPQMMFFLGGLQKSLNMRLKAGFVVTVNDLCKQLKLPETAAGQIAGWSPDSDGDGYIDFGVDCDADYTNYADYGLEYEKDEQTGKYYPVYNLTLNIDGVVLGALDVFAH